MSSPSPEPESVEASSTAQSETVSVNNQQPGISLRSESEFRMIRDFQSYDLLINELVVHLKQHYRPNQAESTGFAIHMKGSLHNNSDMIFWEGSNPHCIFHRPEYFELARRWLTSTTSPPTFHGLIGSAAIGKSVLAYLFLPAYFKVFVGLGICPFNCLCISNSRTGIYIVIQHDSGSFQFMQTPASIMSGTPPLDVNTTFYVFDDIDRENAPSEWARRGVCFCRNPMSSNWINFVAMTGERFIVSVSILNPWTKNQLIEAQKVPQDLNPEDILHWSTAVLPSTEKLESFYSLLPGASCAASRSQNSLQNASIDLISRLAGSPLVFLIAVPENSLLGKFRVGPRPTNCTASTIAIPSGDNNLVNWSADWNNATIVFRNHHAVEECIRELRGRTISYISEMWSKVIAFEMWRVAELILIARISTPEGIFVRRTDSLVYIAENWQPQDYTLEGGEAAYLKNWAELLSTITTRAEAPSDQEQGRPPIFIVPRSSNFEAIDACFISQKRISFIQITLSKSRDGSHDARTFEKQISKWSAETILTFDEVVWIYIGANKNLKSLQKAGSNFYTSLFGTARSETPSLNQLSRVQQSTLKTKFFIRVLELGLHQMAEEHTNMPFIR